jgi:hypothetical protein
MMSGRKERKERVRWFYLLVFSVDFFSRYGMGMGMVWRATLLITFYITAYIT